MRKKGFCKKVTALMLGLSLALTGIEPIGMKEFSTNIAEAATEVNILNYESNKTASEYVITDIAGMEKLAELVNSGTTDFTGKTITLKNDLQYDKSVENNYTIIGVGYSETIFCGTFLGESHKISGVNINSSEKCVGLFGYCEGIIDGIYLEDSSITGSANAGIVGGIAARINGNNGKGVITNCVILKNTEVIAKGISSCAGGITGYVGGSSSPRLSGCVNYGLVQGGRVVGGIVGIGDSYIDGIAITLCCNFGTVQQTSGDVDSFAGGISGENFEGIVNCFNAGAVISGTTRSAYNAYAGGVSGQAYSSSCNNTLPLCINCYNVGQVSQGGYYGSVTCVTAPYSILPGIENCYWLQGTSSIGVNTDKVDKGLDYDLSSVYMYSQAQMQAKDFVDTLNKNSVTLGYGEVWEEDTHNINNGYPVLKGVSYDEETSESNEEIDNGTPVSHLYKDYDYTQSVTDETIQIYANGGTVTGTDGVKKNTKSKVIYTDILASYLYKLDKKGNVVPTVGKVIVGVTSDNSVPTLVKGKVIDKDAAKIAKASIKNGQITVTAQSQAGTVYLWVIDTGKNNVMALCPITVKMAPASMIVLNKPYTDTTAKKCISTSVKVGDATYVYLKPLATDKKTVVTDATYQAVVSDAARAYVSVSATTDPYCFKIKAISKKTKGTTKVTVKFVCRQSGKAGSVAVTVK